MSAFDLLTAFGSTPRTIQLYLPEDVTGAGKEGNDPPFVVRPGAIGAAVTIRPLTMAERAAADLIMEAAQPPPAFREEPGERPGMPMRRVQDGFDEADPAYLAKLRELRDRHDAMIVLQGVVGMLESTPGADLPAKVDTLIGSMATMLVRYLAAEIANASWAAGNKDDFFTSGDSSSSPSSEPMPSKSPKGTKRK